MTMVKNPRRKVIAVDTLLPLNGRSPLEMRQNAYAQKGDLLTIVDEDPFNNSACFLLQGKRRPEAFYANRSAVQFTEAE